MDIINLIIIFIALIAVLKFKKPLHFAILFACAVAILIYSMPVLETVEVMGLAIIKSKTLTAVGVFYVLSVLQEMLEEEGYFSRANKALEKLSKRNRINVLLAPIVLGMLPSANAVLIAAPFIEKGCGDSLNNVEKAFVTSFARHVPESSVNTFASVILALSLCTVPAGSFLFFMIPVMVFAVFLIYIFYMRKIPKYTNASGTESRAQELKELFSCLWTIIILIGIILVLGVPVICASIFIVVIFTLFKRFSPSRLWHYMVKGYHNKLILSTFCVYIFADVIAKTGALSRLPETFKTLSIPLFLVFAIVFFIGTVIGNIQSVTAIALPLAFAAIPNSGVALLMLLMGIGYAAMQVSPAHICLTIAADRFDVNIKDLMQESLPKVLILCLFIILYYILLVNVFGIN